MSASLSNVSLGTYIQMVSAASNIIEKAEEFCKENNINSQEIVEMQLYKDMSPFTFQVFSIVHHSVGALDALRTGEFGPPKMPDNLNFENCKNMLKEAEKNLMNINPSEIDNLEQAILHSDYLVIVDDEKKNLSKQFKKHKNLFNAHKKTKTMYLTVPEKSKWSDVSKKIETLLRKI